MYARENKLKRFNLTHNFFKEDSKIFFSFSMFLFKCVSATVELCFSSLYKLVNEGFSLFSVKIFCFYHWSPGHMRLDFSIEAT